MKIAVGQSRSQDEWLEEGAFQHLVFLPISPEFQILEN